MAGHSKWANIKHRKERADAKKGKAFTRVTKEIINAVKSGGADPKANPKLRLALQKAKEVNLPNENIERNIKKASSQDQASYLEVCYEVYGHGGVGILAEGLTDNKNRSASDMRIAINKCGGSIASIGAVSFNFEKKGVLHIPCTAIEEDTAFLLASENGADEFEKTEEYYIITCDPTYLAQCKEAFIEKHASPSYAELEMLPVTMVEVDEETKQQNIKLIDWIENIDDIDQVFHNMKME